MTPYWQSADGTITVYNARCEDVIASVLPVREVALVHADPVYGIDFTAARKRGAKSSIRSAGGAYGKEWEKLEGDDKPYDPAPILALGRPTVLWGANNYASRLPDSGGWIVWDKKRGGTASQKHKASDAELAWSNIGRMVDVFSYFWDGFRREGEVGSHLYPTQKPVALSVHVFQFAKLKRGDLVFVPYLGSGPDLTAAEAMGLRVIACDVSEKACGIAVSARLGAITPERAAEPVGPLFSQRA